jgi:hypothetical protein
VLALVLVWRPARILLLVLSQLLILRRPSLAARLNSQGSHQYRDGGASRMLALVRTLARILANMLALALALASSQVSILSQVLLLVRLKSAESD